MKSVLISIQPKWCELIKSGEKKVEVRKSRPKLETPFKVYIYQTKALYKPNGCKHLFMGEGKVIGEFVCDEIKEIRADNLVAIYFNNPIEKTCLNDLEMLQYANGKNLFLWHISNLVIYDEPRKLSEFQKPCIRDFSDCAGCENAYFTYSYGFEGCALEEGLTRPPQSWCYVESEVEGE